MKKYFIKAAFIATLVGAIFATYAGTASAQTAYVAWNTYTNDCATVMIGNDSTQDGVGTACWPTSISAQPGDTINVRIYYHNTGTAAAGNLIATLNQAPTDARTSFAFTGILSGGQAQASGQAHLNLPSAQTLTLSNVAVYPDKQVTPNYVSNSSIFNGGLSLGKIDPPSTCPTSNSFCHQGSIVVSYKIGNATTTTTGGTTPCKITSFNATPNSIQSGASSTLTWNTTGCTSVSIAGGRISGNYNASGSVSTLALASTTTFKLTATGNGASPSATQIVNVNSVVTNPTLCSITSFNASPTSVNSGGSSTLAWNTNGCTSVSISGGSVSGTYGANTNISTGGITTATTYTLIAYSATGVTVTQTVTITVNTVVNNNCQISNFYASPTQVPQGGSTTLYWNTTGCSSVSVNGPNFNSVQMSGSQSVGPINGTSNYTLTAYSSTGSPVTQTVTVTNTTGSTGSAPIASTLAAQANDGTTATLNGYINSGSGSSCGSFWGSCGSTTYYFQYGTSQYSLYQSTQTQTMNGTSGNVSAYVSGLTPNTTYYFQLIATNSYGTSNGGVLSFVTNTGSGSTSVSVITTLATNVSARTARLNGLVTGSNASSYSTANVYFEYGTSPSLGLRTTAQNAYLASASNYFDTIFTAPNTTYYYRIDAVVNGQTYMGSTVSFSTPGATFINTNTNTNTNTTTRNTTVVSTIGTGGGSAFLQLAITDQAQSIFPGDGLNYVVTYQNISGITLSNVVINVILPTGVTFRQASQGILTTNNTVAISVGTLLPTAQGMITIQAVTDATIVPGNNFVTTATAAFTLPSTAQDSAVAYVLNSVATRNNLAGLALFGFGFFPTTLLGWILLLGLILILILIARYYYHRANAQRAAAAPVTHVHYETPVAPNTHTGYHGDNLPH
jgi:hypothetical protein